LADAKRRAKDASATAEFLSEAEIIGKGASRAKADYDERMASIQKGREGREKFGSKTAKWKAEKGSSTNEEKKKNKVFQMVCPALFCYRRVQVGLKMWFSLQAAHSNQVYSKKNASLREKQKKLLGHKKKQKKQRLK
jgi:protein SDA1